MTFTGKRFGNFEFVSLLGAGGMGEVYLAKDTELDRPVALKVLPASVSQDEDRVRRFVQEAKAASALNHPNILTVYEIGQIEQARFIVSEYVKGQTLRQRLKIEPPSLNESLEIAVQIAAALNAAHEAGIVHRDIKPENIMLREDGLVKVLDFGLAKLTGKMVGTFDAEATTIVAVKTEPGLVMGTVSYMSPEQARGKDTDARTDIWSIGVVLYEMLGQKQPFEGETTSDRLAEILKTEPPSLSEIAPDVPHELERIVSKALRKDREERYQTVKDLLIDLKDVKQDLVFSAQLERSGRSTAHNSGQRKAGQSSGIKAFKTGGTIHSTEPTLEYIVEGVRRNYLGIFAVLLMLFAAVAGVVYFGFSRNTASNAKSSVKSIVVLPLANESGNADAEYISDGISESLINNLSRLSGMKVIARSSSFKYKGKDTDPQEIAKSLDVESVLTGRIKQVGENLQISVELINPFDKTQMWGEQYMRRADDLQSLQTDISREIVDKLRLRLTTGEQQQLTRRETTNSQAYELLLKGRFYRNKGGNENRKKSLEFLQQAVEVDPNYALAHAELALSYWNLVGNNILHPDEGNPKGLSAAQKALELDESSAEAHYALAVLKQDAWEWQESDRAFKRALELNPNLARAHFGYSVYLSVKGRHDEAIVAAQRARELDPLSLGINVNIGFVHYFARRYDEAIESLKKTLELDPQYPTTHLYLGYAYTAKAMYQEAISAYEQAIKLGDDGPSIKISLATTYAKAGESEKAKQMLKELQSSDAYVAPGEMAALYTALGDKEAAFASLEKAYTAHDLQLQYLGVDSSLDGLRGDARFQELLQKVGLTPSN